MSGYQHLGDLLDDVVPAPPSGLRAAPLAEIHRRAHQRGLAKAVTAGMVLLLLIAVLALIAAQLRR